MDGILGEFWGRYAPIMLVVFSLFCRKFSPRTYPTTILERSLQVLSTYTVGPPIAYSVRGYGGPHSPGQHIFSSTSTTCGCELPTLTQERRLLRAKDMSLADIRAVIIYERQRALEGFPHGLAKELFLAPASHPYTLFFCYGHAEDIPSSGHE